MWYQVDPSYYSSAKDAACILGKFYAEGLGIVEYGYNSVSARPVIFTEDGRLFSCRWQQLLEHFDAHWKEAKLDA